MVVAAGPPKLYLSTAQVRLARGLLLKHGLKDRCGERNAAGEMTGSDKLRAEGKADQTVGEVKASLRQGYASVKNCATEVCRSERMQLSSRC